MPSTQDRVGGGAPPRRWRRPLLLPLLAAALLALLASGACAQRTAQHLGPQASRRSQLGPRGIRVRERLERANLARASGGFALGTPLPASTADNEQVEEDGGEEEDLRPDLEEDLPNLEPQSPANNLLLRWGRQAGEPTVPEREAAQLVQDFFLRFYNSDHFCNQQNFAKTSISLSNRAEGEGLGSLLNGYSISAMNALVRGRRACTHDTRSNYINKLTCPSQTWDCLFQPISDACPCAEMAEVGPQLATVNNFRCITSKEAATPIRETKLSNGDNFFIYDHLTKFDAALPFRSDHWYMAQLYYYLFRPNEDLQQYFKVLKAKLFPDWDGKRTVSVHIRRGDHWMGAHLGDDAYVETIRRVVNATSANTVFLGTDDIVALEELPRKLAPIKVVSIPADYSIIGKIGANCKGMNKDCRAAKYLRTTGEATDEGKLLMSQILLMVDSIVTIGTIGSNFSRVIHQLQWASKALQNGLLSPDLAFLDMSGDHYFMCGWRLSQHMQRDNKKVVDEWIAKYAYYSAATKTRDL